MLSFQDILNQAKHYDLTLKIVEGSTAPLAVFVASTDGHSFGQSSSSSGGQARISGGQASGSHNSGHGGSSHGNCNGDCGGVNSTSLVAKYAGGALCRQVPSIFSS